MGEQMLEVRDYETEFKDFEEKLLANRNAFTKILATNNSEANSLCRMYCDLADKAKNEIKEVKERIESVQKEIASVQTDKDLAGREHQRLVQELDRINMTISQKAHERDCQQKKLAESEQRVKEREERVKGTERKNQSFISNMEKCAELYHKHLGLRMQHTNHNTLVFIFTQISREEPSKEYLLEITMEGDNYRLLKSFPPIPNLPELENRLNATSNLTGCFVHVRKFFQKVDVKDNA